MLESKQVHSRPQVELLESYPSTVRSKKFHKKNSEMRQKYELDQQFFGNLISSLESQEPGGFIGKVAELPLTCVMKS